MKAVRKFDEFIKEGIVKLQSPDKSRAEFLIKESEKMLVGLNERLKIMGIDENNTNSIIKDCYDILMGLIRAKMFLEGFNASGYRAHEAEVSYMENIGFSENEVQFADQIRFFRNGMLYYGTILDKEYAEKVIKFTRESYKKIIGFLDFKRSR